MRHQIFSAVALITAVSAFVSVESQQRTSVTLDRCRCDGKVVDRTIDFETDAYGRFFNSGDIPSELPYGVTAVGQRRQKGKVGAPTENDLIIFDTEVPTGMDYDLAIDGEKKVLILQEDDDRTDPDDAQ